MIPMMFIVVLNTCNFTAKTSMVLPTPFWLKCCTKLVAPLLCSFSPQVGLVKQHFAHVDFIGAIGAMDLPQTLPGVPAPSIDPTAAELLSINDLDGIFTWLGMQEAARTALLAVLGGGTPAIRDVVFIRGTDWDAAVDGTRIPVAEGDPRNPTPIERGHFAMVRRIARLRLNLPANEVRPGAFAPPQVAPPAAPGDDALARAGPPPPAFSAEPKIKLSLLLDPSLDTDLVRLPHVKIRALYTKYAEVRGAEPAEDVEPTVEQISALAQVVSSDLTPYADFSLWGPYGKRLVGKLSFLAWNFQPDGTWHRRELPGPPSFEHWWSSFRVYRTAILLLDLAPPEHLDNYGEMDRTFANQYGPHSWYLVYQADTRMRSEHFERLRRLAERDSGAFNPGKPWFTIFKLAIEDKLWWDEHLHRPAVLFLTNVKTATETADDGTVQQGIPDGRGNGRRRSRSRKALRGGGKASPTDQQGRMVTKSGMPYCDAYNTPAGCDRQNCKYFHGCKKCKAPRHGQHRCFSGGNPLVLTPNSSSSNVPPPPAPFRGDGGRTGNGRRGNGRRR